MIVESDVYFPPRPGITSGGARFLSVVQSQPASLFATSPELRSYVPTTTAALRVQTGNEATSPVPVPSPPPPQTDAAQRPPPPPPPSADSKAALNGCDYSAIIAAVRQAIPTMGGRGGGGRGRRLAQNSARGDAIGGTSTLLMDFVA